MASRMEPMWMELRCVMMERSVNVICTSTSVMGSGIARTASLLNTDMPAEQNM